MRYWLIAVFCFFVSLLGQPVWAIIVKDTGVRGGAPEVGGALPDIGEFERTLFRDGKLRAGELETTCESCISLTKGASSRTDPLLATRTSTTGLNARFNADQCIACHSQPVPGGSGGFMVPNPKDAAWRLPENPLFDLVPHRHGQSNVVPSFIKQYGPIRIARFIKKADGTPDGKIYPLFTVVGRNDDPSLAKCTAQLLPQPNFEAELKNNNVAFRIPLQLFGLGLIEAIPNAEILARHRASAAYRAQHGILGVANGSPAYRFGWKAQHKSLAPFTNPNTDVAPALLKLPAPCAIGDAPVFPDSIKLEAADADLIHPAVLPGVSFARYLDAPRPAKFSALALRGQHLFGLGPEQPGIGCVACHTASMNTADKTESPIFQRRAVNLYSDLLLHHMGSGLADSIVQGQAKGDMFRTTPLWGLGLRRFFLHDGRTDDLLQAIEAHASPAGNGYPASEANAVIQRFKALPPLDQQAILLFLRAL